MTNTINLMADLESKLEESGYFWVKKTLDEIVDYKKLNIGIKCITHHMEEIYIEKNNEGGLLEFKYGYFDNDGDQKAWSFGWPDKFEFEGEPISIDEIMEFLEKGK